MSSKRGVFHLDKILTISLVVFVLVLVFAFLFFANIPGFFKLFPSFSQTDLSGTYSQPENTFVEQCIKVGEIKTEERRQGVEDKQQYIYFNGERTDLYWGEKGKEVLLKRSLGGVDRLKSDVIIGSIDSLGVLDIKEEYLDEKSKSFIEMKNILPPINILQSLDDSRYIQGNILCKLFVVPDSSQSNLDSEKLTKLMESLRDKSLIRRTCECGENCGRYAKEIMGNSETYGIDPTLALSLMMQESDCEWNAFAKHPTDSDRDSVGLMQVSSWAICKSNPSLGINSKTDTVGEANIEKNIGCGFYILDVYRKQHYTKGVLFEGCKKTKTYYGWGAALRAYNGLGCLKSMPEQDEFVEEIFQRQMEIIKINIPN